MRVCDYDVEFGNGVMTCCMDHIMSCNDRCKEGSIIRCEHCGARMKLTRRGSKLMWAGIR